MISFSYKIANFFRVKELDNADETMFMLRMFITAAALPASILMTVIAMVDQDYPLYGFGATVFGIFLTGRTKYYRYLAYVIGLLVPIMMTYYASQDVLLGPRDITGSVMWLIIPIFIAASWVSTGGTLVVTIIQLLGIFAFVFIRASDTLVIDASLFYRPVGFLILGAGAIVSPVYGYRRVRENLVKSNAQLTQSDKELRRLFDNLPIGFYRTSADGAILKANPSAYQITGHASEKELMDQIQAVSRQWYVDPNRRNAFVSMIQTQGYVNNFESPVYRGDEIIWVSESAYPVYKDNGELDYYEGAIQDITKRKNAEAALNRTVSQMQLINDNIPAWIAYVDSNYKFQFANRFFETRIGLPEGWMVGKHVREFVGEDYWLKVEPQIQRLLKGEPLVLEIPGKTVDGEDIFTRVTHVPHFSDNGEIPGYFLLGLDITDQRQAEQTIRQLHKVESLGMVAGGVAHDFNNLLTGIMAQSSLAVRKLGDEHPVTKNVQRVLTASRSAERLVKQLLAYSGDEHLNNSPVDLNTLIEKSLQNTSFSTGQLINVETDLSNQIPRIWADDTKVEQIMINLITNSAQAIEKTQGLIKISTELKHIAAGDSDYARLTGEALAPDEYVVLTVTDNGCGIPADKLLQIFDPFFTTKFSGHGLGLAAVLGTMRAHYGGIKVKSEVGIGTTFSLVFPVNHPLAMHQDLSPATKPEDQMMVVEA